jgi:hypothetical protein
MVLLSVLICLNGRYIFDPPDHVCVDHGFETLFWPLYGLRPEWL